MILEMEKVIVNYNKAYHALPAIPFESSCKIKEPCNEVKDGKLCEVCLTGFNGYSFPHELPEKLSSFVKIATVMKADEGIKCVSGKLSDGKEHYLMKDCDGVIFFEKGGQKYMLFCELKSSYCSEEIFKAKNQICASYIKVKALMGTLQDFCLQEFMPIGMIFSYGPNPEEKTMNSKNLLPEAKAQISQKN